MNTCQQDLAISCFFLAINTLILRLYVHYANPYKIITKTISYCMVQLYDYVTMANSGKGRWRNWVSEVTPDTFHWKLYAWDLHVNLLQLQLTQFKNFIKLSLFQLPISLSIYQCPHCVIWHICVTAFEGHKFC